MRALKLSRLERALVRKLYARRNTAATLMRMFQCCQTTVNRAVRNHMGDDIDDDDAIIRDADLPADVTAMLGLKDRDDDKALTTTGTNRWRPWAPTKVIPRRTPALRTVPKTVTRRSPKVSVEATESDIKPQTVAAATSGVRYAHYSSGIPRYNVTQTGSALPNWEKPAPDSLASVEGFLASIQLGEAHAQMLLDEGIKTHQDLLHIKEIVGTESLKLVRESLKARGFTTFELIKFISAVKGIPS
ncbi:hypothetical protein EDB89DRAFT_2076395 [Lactarius sanguifluus]|nr:hypothetical protein EDB89DRAFT_2080474 [Lactarius sanguifluus]KAH9165867.1 hypothetical protein EDB89DRAFT_2076395 [Lactarius sanguifluus]